MSEQPLPKPEQTIPTLDVQPASPEDAAGVFDVQRQTWIDTYPNEEAGITEQDVRNRVEGEHGELVADKIAWWRKGIETSGENRAIFVVKDEDKVVGFVAPGIMDGQRRIGAIYVLPEAQGKGLGRKLLDKAIDWHGRDEDIYLHVASYNENAIGFYEKNGFEKTGRDIEDLDARERGVVEIPEIEMVLKADSNSDEEGGTFELSLSKIADNPELVTENLETADHENVVMRPLMVEDSKSLAEFLDGLSEETRRLVDFKGNKEEISGKMIEAINRYDKQRLVIENSEHIIIGLMELSFGLPEDDVKRYAGYGIKLDEATDCRFGPSLADDYQGSGLGSKAFPLMADIARRFGKSRMILWGGVLADNTRAIHFYEKFGFINVGSFTDDRDDLVDMMLSL